MINGDLPSSWVALLPDRRCRPGNLLACCLTEIRETRRNPYTFPGWRKVQGMRERTVFGNAVLSRRQR